MRHHNTQIFGDQINYPFFCLFFTNGISETALHTESESESETGQIRHG